MGIHIKGIDMPPEGQGRILLVKGNGEVSDWFDLERKVIASAAQSEIVRCKDCKYWEQNAQHGFDEDNEEYHNYCARLVSDDDYYAFTREANDFCSYAERRADE